MMFKNYCRERGSEKQHTESELPKAFTPTYSRNQQELSRFIIQAAKSHQFQQQTNNLLLVERCMAIHSHFVALGPLPTSPFEGAEEGFL